ncbi:MAG: PqiC family protein [Pseudodesulfovibrio sp.]
MKKQSILIFLLALALTATACVKLGGQPIDKKFYRITPARTDPPASDKGDIVLKVRRMTISDIYNTRELVYQMGDGHIESDFYNMFFVTPGNMLTTELRNWLNASGQFAHIINPGSMVISDLTLEGVVNSLYGDYSADQPVAEVAMQFFVVDESTPENQIVFSKSYRQRVPLTEPDPQQLVQALTKGVQAIFTELEHDLAAAPLK